MYYIAIAQDILYLDKNKGAPRARTDQVDPRHDGDEDGNCDDDGVEDHLEPELHSLQVDGGAEIDEKGADDGESAAWEKDEPEDLQHLRRREVVVFVGFDVQEVKSGNITRDDQNRYEGIEDGEESKRLFRINFVFLL